jgi:hypothetical protein
MIEPIYSGYTNISWVLLGIEMDKQNPNFGLLFCKMETRGDGLERWKPLTDIKPFAARICGDRA